MKKTFRVTMRKTITHEQVVTVQAGSADNALDMAHNRVDEQAWEYDTDYIEAIGNTIPITSKRLK